MKEPLIRRVLGYNDDIYTDSDHWYSTGGAPYITGTWNNPSVMNKGDTVGYDTPNFHARVKRGELIPSTPFTQYRYYGTTTGDYDVRHNANNWHGYITPVGGFNHQLEWLIEQSELDALVPSDLDQDVQAAAAKIYSSESFDALTFIAELTDVKRTFFQVGKRLLDIRLPKNWKVLSSEWLAYRYGIRPLINEIKTLDELCKTYGDKMTRRSDRSGRRWTSSDLTEWTTYVTGQYYRDFAIRDEYIFSTRGNVAADVDVPKIQFNPLQTGWEIIPFSFVIDWFISIGRVLSAASFLALNPSFAASKGYSVTIKREFSMESHSYENGWSGISDQYGSSEAEIQRRIPCAVSLQPQLRFNLSIQKILDLCALVIQRK